MGMTWRGNGQFWTYLPNSMDLYLLKLISCALWKKLPVSHRGQSWVPSMKVSHLKNNQPLGGQLAAKAPARRKSSVVMVPFLRMDRRHSVGELSLPTRKTSWVHKPKDVSWRPTLSICTRDGWDTLCFPLVQFLDPITDYGWKTQQKSHLSKAMGTTWRL